jgi:haloacetate dehalogenase
MFTGFRREYIEVGEVIIHAVIGGFGPPLLLLHGYPQSHIMWHKVAEYLAQHFTVVAADMRGYGDSSKPQGKTDHSNYSKRVMAQDQVRLMQRLGFDKFFLAGHDRGGRVSHRLAIDHPERVRKLAVLDISPTKKMYEQTDQAFARAYYHWFFLIQPHPFPEKLIQSEAEYYLLKKIGSGSAGLSPFTEEALTEYKRCFTPEMIHTSCEDYRAAATIDLEYDKQDIQQGHKIHCPLLVLWGEYGVVERCFSPLQDWSEVAIDVRGHTLPGGHYLAEELPELVTEELISFFLDV